MEEELLRNPPSQCPVCGNRLAVTRLECVSCSTDVTGAFALGRLATTPEPHASLLEMFLRVRGNVKEMERELGLSYPTVRARLDEAFEAAGYGRVNDRPSVAGEDVTIGAQLSDRIRRQVEQGLSQMERGLSHIDIQPNSQRTRRKDVLARERRSVLDRLEAGEISPRDAAQQLRTLNERTH